MPLNRDPNIADPDAFYPTLIDAHADLTDADSLAFNTRLVLLLANHIGDFGAAGGHRDSAQVARPARLSRCSSGPNAREKVSLA